MRWVRAYCRSRVQVLARARRPDRPSTRPPNARLRARFVEAAGVDCVAATFVLRRDVRCPRAGFVAAPDAGPRRAGVAGADAATDADAAATESSRGDERDATTRLGAVLELAVAGAPLRRRAARAARSRPALACALALLLRRCAEAAVSPLSAPESPSPPPNRRLQYDAYARTLRSAAWSAHTAAQSPRQNTVQLLAAKAPQPYNSLGSDHPGCRNPATNRLRVRSLLRPRGSSSAAMAPSSPSATWLGVGYSAKKAAIVSRTLPLPEVREHMIHVASSRHASCAYCS